MRLVILGRCHDWEFKANSADSLRYYEYSDDRECVNSTCVSELLRVRDSDNDKYGIHWRTCKLSARACFYLCGCTYESVCVHASAGALVTSLKQQLLHGK